LNDTKYFINSSWRKFTSETAYIEHLPSNNCRSDRTVGKILWFLTTFLLKASSIDWSRTRIDSAPLSSLCKSKMNTQFLSRSILPFHNHILTRIRLTLYYHIFLFCLFFLYLFSSCQLVTMRYAREFFLGFLSHQKQKIIYFFSLFFFYSPHFSWLKFIQVAIEIIQIYAWLRKKQYF